jgi:competence protein ComEC
VGQTVQLTGTVSREPEVRETTTHLYVTVNDDLLLVTTDRFTSAQYGDELTITGRLEEPQSFTTDLGKEFNYQKYLLARGVEYRISYANVAVMSGGHGNPFLTVLFLVKQALITGIERSIEEPQSGLGQGLLLGVKQALGNDLEDTFRKAGIIHIVVLSGYNVMLVVAFVMFFLSAFLLPKTRIVIGLTAIAAFALMVGLSATVVRASIMASLLLVAQAFGRTYDMLRALLFAGAVMICINPFLLLYDIGFQLSFMATLGLVLLAPQFESLLAKRPALLSAKEYVIATVATQIAVLPLLLYHIGEVSLVAVIVNLLVLPVVPLAMLLTFLTGLLTITAPTISLPFAFLAQLVLSFIILVANWFAALPFAALTVSQFSLAALTVSYGILAFVLVFLHRRSFVGNEVRDWVIEEEKIVDIASTVSAKDPTPIFFR